MKKSVKYLLAAAAALMCFNATAQTEKEKPTVHMVSNAHFDTQWRWTVQTSIDEFVYNTLVQNFALLEQYPDYIFNFEGAVKYLWAKEYYPDLYAKLKEYVKSGRWHISGASWDANDPNMPSIESSIRNIMLGQEFYRKEFGILSTDIMLPDCFGFGYQLPSVAAHCGLIGFGTQKLAWRMQPFYEDGRKFPFYFGIWKGLDGGRVMAAMDGGAYSWSPSEPITDLQDLKTRIDGTPVPAAYRYFGTGDTGGSGTPTGVRLISQAVHNPGPAYNVKFATTDDMFKEYLWDERLPEYDGELLMDVHATGNYTSKVEMKMLNRRNERMLGAAEGISSMAEHFGAGQYPAYTLDEGWKRVIWHQFHDDLTGTSLPECYQFSYNDEYINLSQMNSLVETGMASVASIMNTTAKGTPVLVYNHVTAANNDLVTMEMNLPEQYRSVEVYGPDGRKVKSQIIARDGDCATVIFAGTDPSLGLSVYDARPSARAEAGKSALKASANGLENKIYRITLDENGDICSIIDKRYGKELVRKGESFGYAFFTDNESEKWPAWEILKKVIDRTPEKVNGDVRISVEECGALRAVVKVEKTYAGSSFTQRIVLTDGAADDRIDVINTVDWNSRASLLKASFPVAFDAPEATYDLGMGHIRRGNNTETAYEVIAQQWADMTTADGSYGVTIMNDGRYGWDKPDDHTIRLTLIHTPTASTRYTEQATQDFGEHTFTYSITGHKGALVDASADIAADKLNQKKIAQMVDSHPGKLGKTFSLVSSTNPAIRVKAFKKAQDGDGFVVRAYTLSETGAKGQISFAADIVSAEELNGIEDHKGDASFAGKTLNVEGGKFALKTFRVRLADPAVKIEKASYESVALPYNIVAITSDNFTTQGRLGRERESFAAEILPETLRYRGIPFTFGEADYNDAVFCDGQKISVPEGTKTLHLLMASSGFRPQRGAQTRERHDAPVTGTFTVGDKSIDRTVSYYTGFYGVYGWPGYYESVMRDDDIAYVGSHTHNPKVRNKAYSFSYMYLVSIPVDGASEVVLPDDSRLFIFSATAEK
ncbi:MAG: alpha-mannosidase [Bacteroidales bacterium]|nr:alpha-mannosidase [Candidatus Cryptobacteroides onthequi]